MSTQPPDALSWRQLNEYLDHGFELALEQREQWLQELAGTDPGLAQRLRELFAQHDRLSARGFLGGTALQAVDASLLHASSMAGKRVGAYTIERLLGCGGMGEVWLASRSDGRFEGRCAIKLLDNTVASPKLADRFRREGRLLARLTHPNIARLIDAGVVEDDRQYLALEYVDGEPIDRYCESRALALVARVRLFLDVVSAVAHAHANLVIHRDIKPSNVLVTHEGAAKLLDFGIAKLLHAETTDSEPTLTRHGDVALTPAYAAPEQLLGDEPSTATDVYQLGLLLYVLLTGRRNTTRSRAERLRAVLEGEVPLASEITTGATRKALRGDLDAILARAMHKEPKERYATAAALHDDLARYLKYEPVEARRGAALYAARRFVRRHRLAVLASGLAVLGLCVAVVMVSAERDRAFAMARSNAAVTDFMEAMITEAAGSDEPVSVSDMVAHGEQLVLADQGRDRESQAAVLLMIANYRDSIGDQAKTLQLLDRGLALLKDSRDEDLRAQLVCGRAVVSAESDRSDAPVRGVTSEIERTAPRTTGRAECLFDRALIGLYMDDADSALRYSSEALVHLRASPLASKTHEANYMAALAQAYSAKGRNVQAFETYERVLQMFTDLGLEHGEQSISVRNNLGTAYVAAGMPRRALPLYDEILKAMAARTAGAIHPVYLLNRAHTLEVLGGYPDAFAAYQRALEAATKNGDLTSRSGSLVGLANTSRLMGNLTAAAGYLDQAQDALSPTEAADTYPSIRLALARGLLDLALGKIDDAQTELARASIAPRSKTATQDIQRAKSEAALLAGDAVASEQNARASLATATSLQGGMPWSYRTGLSWLILGRALHRRGEDAQAHAAFVAALDNLLNTVDADHPALIRARALAAGNFQSVER
jgi:serine/threonine-protein kinase